MAYCKIVFFSFFFPPLNFHCFSVSNVPARSRLALHPAEQPPSLGWGSGPYLKLVQLRAHFSPWAGSGHPRPGSVPSLPHSLLCVVGQTWLVCGLPWHHKAAHAQSALLDQENRCYANCSRLEFSFWVSKNAMVKSKVKQMLSFQILNSQVNVHCRLLIIIWTSANEWCKWKFCYCTEPSFHQTYEESSRPLGYIFLLSKFTTCVNQVATFIRF